MASLLQDLRYSVRMLAKDLGFTAVVVLACSPSTGRCDP